MNNFISDSRVGRYYVLLVSVFIDAPLFQKDLQLIDDTKVLQSATEAEEKRVLVKEYRTLEAINNSTQYGRRCRWFVRLFTYLFMTKTAIYLYIMHIRLDFSSNNEKRPTIERIENHKADVPSVLYLYGCIASNCSDSKIATQSSNTAQSRLNLELLSVFTICYPKIAHYYEPIANELGQGSSYFASLTIYLILIEFAVSKWASNLRADNPLLVFLVAPNLAYKTMLERARAYLKEVRYSYQNYLEVERQGRFQRVDVAHCEVDYTGFAGSDFDHHLTFRHSNRFFQPGITVNSIMMSNFGHIEETKSAADCLPLIRSQWWLEILKDNIIQLLTPLILATIIVASGSAYYMNILHRGQTQKLHLEAFKANCSIWRETGESMKEVSLEKLDSSTYYLAMLPFMVTIYWMSIWGLITLMADFFSVWELRCWSCELQYKLSMMRLVVKELFHRHNEMDQILFNNEPDLMFRIDEFRAQFTSEIHPRWLLMRHKSFIKLNQQMANEQLLEKNYCQAPTTHNRWQIDPERHLAEQFEKLYVELRILVDLQAKVERNISVITIGEIIASYANCSVSIYVIKMMQKFLLMPLLFATVGQLTPMVLILNSVFVKTEVLKLNPLIASIQADLSHATSHRLKHIRSLWQRFADDFTPKALAMSSNKYSIHFTYVSMIQIVVSAATMFLFAVKT